MSDHEAEQQPTSGDRYDVQNVSGNIAIGPGARVKVTNDYRFARPTAIDASTLVETLDRLASLPTDVVPAPAGALPLGSSMPLSHNPLFVGRESDLTKLAQLMKEGQTTVVATGIGGSGKSQLASEFVHRYGLYFAGGVFWLSLADPEAVPAQVAASGGTAGLNLRPDFDQLPLAAQVSAVLAAWQSPLPRLLVFDNCEAVSLLQRWRPPGGGCRLLVTSRRAEWPNSLNVVTQPVPPLTRDEGVRLLAQHRPDADWAELYDIADILGDLPLALHLAGSFLETYAGERFATTFALINQLQSENPLATRAMTGIGATPSATGHELHLARTFALSWERLQGDNDIDKTARMLMAIAAHFAPGEPFARSLLNEAVTRVDTFVKADAIKKLLAVGLLQTEARSSLLVHGLVASFVRQVADESEGALPVAVHVLTGQAVAVNKSGMPGPLLAEQVHLRHVGEAATVRGLAEAGGLWAEFGYHLHVIADYAGARTALERALALDEAAFGHEDARVAKTVNSLGLVMFAQADYAGARVAHERALAIIEGIRGPDHPTVARDVNNLGAVLAALGDFAGARAAQERALAIDEAHFGPNHPNVAYDVNSLGLVLQAQGDYAGALAAFARALAIDEAAYGRDHPEVAVDANNVGGVLQAMGDLEGARAAYERALAIDETVFGPDHPKVAARINNVGSVLEAQGDFAGAWAAYERALAIDEAAFGPDHPDVARSVNNLGMVLLAQGDYAGARAALERALAIDQAAFGPDHPNVAIGSSNLGRVLEAQEDYEGAQAAYERALAINETGFGPSHPEVARNLSSLGSVLQVVGDFVRARAVYERALAIDEAALGPDDPKVAMRVRSLGGILEDLGDYDGARAAYKRALAINTAVFGLDHLEVARDWNDLGGVLAAHRKNDAARAAYGQALAILEATRGPDHPSTQAVRENLESVRP